MELVESVQVALQSVKSLFEIVRSAKGLKDSGADMKVTSELAALQDYILNFQEAYMALHRRVTELEDEKRRSHAWESEAARYQLAKIGTRGLVYTLKPGAAGDEPEHWLCAKCYEDKIKSILQFRARTTAFDEHACPRCSSIVLVAHGETFPTMTVSRYDPYEGF